jgi:hypothetical protein
MFVVHNHSSQMVRWWVLVHSGHDQGTEQVIGPGITPLLGLPSGRIVAVPWLRSFHGWSWVQVGHHLHCKAWVQSWENYINNVVYFNFELIFKSRKLFNSFPGNEDLKIWLKLELLKWSSFGVGGIKEVRTPLARPQEGPYFSNAPLLGPYLTQKPPTRGYFTLLFLKKPRN